MRGDINREGITSDQLKEIAVTRCDMTTLYWDAVEKVRAGITSLEEVLARIRQDEFDSRPRRVRAATRATVKSAPTAAGAGSGRYTGPA